MKEIIPVTWWKGLLLLILLVAIAERISIYQDARSLMIDEANLAFNFVDRSYGALFSNLDHAQYAPPLFSVIQKAATEIIGVNEYALRLFPLLSSILLLLTLVWVGRKIISLPYTTWLLGLVGFSWYFLRYGTEVKQYATDGWLALAVVGLALVWPWERMNTQKWLVWALGGACLVWASMPIVFILAGVGFYYLFTAYNQTRRLQSLLPTVATICAWLISFGSYYFSILSSDIGSDYLQDYHAPFFFDPIVSNVAEAKAQYYIFQNLLATIFPKYLPAIGLSALLFFYGAYWMIKSKKQKAILLLTPIALTILASMLHVFTLIPRVSLFLMPFFGLVAAYGAQQIIDRLPATGKWLAGVGLAIIVSLQMNITYLWQPLYVDPIKPAISYINHLADDIPVVVHFEAAPSYRFYSAYYDQSSNYRLHQATVTNWDAFMPVVNEQFEKDRAFWVLIVHTPPEEVKQMRQIWPTPTDSFTLGRAYAYRFDP